MQISAPDKRRYEALLDEEVCLLGDIRELEPGSLEQRQAVARLHDVAARQNRLLTDLGIVGEGP